MITNKTKATLVLFALVILMCGVLMVWLVTSTPTET